MATAAVRQRESTPERAVVQNYFTSTTLLRLKKHFQPPPRGSLLLLSTIDWALIRNLARGRDPVWAAVLQGIDALSTNTTAAQEPKAARAGE